MKILESKHIEDCFDGSYVYELRLGEPITKPDIDALADGSQLQYYPDFARPFFRIVDDRFIIKGIEGNHTVRVIAFETFQTALDMIRHRTNSQILNVS